MSKADKVRKVLALAVDSVVDQIASGRIVCENEATLQLHLSRAVMLAAELFLSDKNEVSFVELERPWHGQRSGRIDLWFGFRIADGCETTCAVEMKFLKKVNHREPNNRYDVFSDILRLEECKSMCDLAFVLVVTDHDHYHSQMSYSSGTSDFDFRHGSSYKAGEMMEYRTANPYGPAFSLTGSYDFSWSTERNGFRYLLSEVVG
ncbi:hypothetical protein [Erythrobacter sp. Alg231-14]|uniref:hypothetical protein n=1 Tax=Erythrobacter sp. Alg231-14 TaxID=1922225 RepID=UPI000D54B6B4